MQNAIQEEVKEEHIAKKDDARIIIADDQPMCIMTVKNFLEQMNYIDRCDFVCNGQEAINLAK